MINDIGIPYPCQELFFDFYRITIFHKKKGSQQNAEILVIYLVAGACNQLYQPLFIARNILLPPPLGMPHSKGGLHA